MDRVRAKNWYFWLWLSPLLTLLPGTRVHRRLLRENRVEPKFWYTPGWERRPVFEPQKMDREALCRGAFEMGRSLYSYRSIFRRLSFQRHPSYQLVANLIYRHSITANRPGM